MHEGRPPQSFKKRELRPSERKIIEALEEKEGIFTEVLERVDISKATFSKSLQDLEEKNKVTRYYDSGKVIIRLTEEAADPVERVLRRLDRITERSVLNLDKGRSILSDEIIEWSQTAGNLEWTTLVPKEEYEKGVRGMFIDKTEQAEVLVQGIYVEKEDLGEVAENVGVEETEKSEGTFSLELPFLAALARWEIEQSVLGNKPKLHYPPAPEFEELYKSIDKLKDGGEITLPVTRTADKNGVKNQEIEEILDWISPLINPPHFDRPNFAAEFCLREARSWVNDLLKLTDIVLEREEGSFLQRFKEVFEGGE